VFIPNGPDDDVDWGDTRQLRLFLDAASWQLEPE
jgi:hypothetical protein